jgi:hypothetical protein
MRSLARLERSSSVDDASLPKVMSSLLPLSYPCTRETIAWVAYSAATRLLQVSSLVGYLVGVYSVAYFSGEWHWRLTDRRSRMCRTSVRSFFKSNHQNQNRLEEENGNRKSNRPSLSSLRLIYISSGRK